jgi:hypothetical protein
MSHPTNKDVALAIQNIVAETMGFQCKINSFISTAPKSDSIRMLKNMIHFFIGFYDTLIPKMPEEFREPFEEILTEMRHAVSKGESGSRSRTRKQLQDGGMSKHRTLGKAPPPPKNQTSIVVHKGVKMTKSALVALNKAADYIRFDEHTRSRIKSLMVLEKRYLVAGKSKQAAMVSATISHLRDEVVLFPMIPSYVLVSSFVFFVYMFPSWFAAAIVSAMSLGVGVPSVVAAGGVAAVGQGAWNALIGSNVTAAERATQVAMVTGSSISNATVVVIDATTQTGHARQLGYVVGALIFISYALKALVSYNIMISKARGDARERHIKLLEQFNTAPTNLPMLEDREARGEAIDEIYTYFGVTDEEAEKPPKEVYEILKKKYRARIKVEHTNKGGERKAFDKTQALFKKAQDLFLTEKEPVDINVDENAAGVGLGGGGRRRRQTQRRRRA